MTLPHAHCITLKETPERTKRLTDHLVEQHIGYTLFEGINAAVMGLTTVFPYEVDAPGSGYIMPQKHTGLCLSHILLWRRLNEFAWRIEDPDLAFMVLEDDAEFVPDWRERLREYWKGVPEDWDMVLIGSCNCADKERDEVAEGVFRVRYPQCTHAYIVKGSALSKLLEQQQRIYAPIDLALVFNSYPHLNVYTILPRLVTQHAQEIAE